MNKFLQKFDQELEDLEIQLNLGSQEVIDAYERQKEAFKGFVHETRESVDHMGSEQASKFKGKLEALQVQLALGRAESRDAYEAQKKKLDEAMQEAAQEYEKLKEETEEDMNEFSAGFKTGVERFQTRLDIMRVKFHLGAADARDEWEEKQKEMKEKFGEMRQQMKKRQTENEQKWDDFSEEVTESYTKFKSAVRGFFS
jgi:hypothetical protein